MRFSRLTVIFTLLACACSIMPQDKGVSTEFHPPLIEKSWDAKYITLPNETKVCSISSGYNGLTIFVSDLHGTKGVDVKSNRLMQPGAILTVNAGGKSFVTYSTIFPADTASALLQSFEGGGKAYLEWAEFSGPPGRERVHVQNIVSLDDFSARLKKCQDSLKGQ